MPNASQQVSAAESMSSLYELSWCNANAGAAIATFEASGACVTSEYTAPRSLERLVVRFRRRL